MNEPVQLGSQLSRLLALTANGVDWGTICMPGSTRPAPHNATVQEFLQNIVAGARHAVFYRLYCVFVAFNEKVSV
jgi:hypothetical protein